MTNEMDDETGEMKMPDIDLNQGVTIKHVITIVVIITLLAGVGVGVNGSDGESRPQNVESASVDRVDGMDTRLKSVERHQLRMGENQQEMMIMMTGMQRDVSNIAESLDVSTAEVER